MPGEQEGRNTDETQTSATENPSACPIVGIGASAGGIQALQKFFPHAIPDSGLAYVVLQHLSPSGPSILVEVLQRLTKLNVKWAADGEEVLPGHIYVMPPDAVLTISESRLHVAKPALPLDHRTPIDNFLISLARDQGERTACVILSGTGSDGTQGLKAVKEHGGLTLAQAGESAEYDGMMRNAVATGLVDYVLPPEEMPTRLTEYFRHLVEMDGRKGPDGLRRETTDYLAQICTLLRARTGHDFSEYKDKTVIRRVQRRMQVLQIDEVPEFVQHLRRNPQEVDLLFQDLLIGVTHFFRDPDAFAALGKLVIPKLFEGKGPDDTIRIWVPGCSTGEEAYSIAMLLRDHMPKARGAPQLQIFASDIDEFSLETARTGRYPAAIEHDVPQKYLQRYFLREDGTYRVIGDLREMCLFSLHNLLRDAPFSRLDLISCRNLLIYLNARLQDRVIPLLHYALRDDGHLFLGTSETVTRHPRLFTTTDKQHHIFRRRPQAQRTLPQFPLAAGALRRSPAPDTRAPSEPSLVGRAERLILERLAPAYALISAEGDVLHFSGRTGKYLEQPAGAPDNNIFSMARPGLRLDLRAVVHRAVVSGRMAVHKNVTVAVNGGWQTVDIVVQAISAERDGDGTTYLVAFQDVGGIHSEGEDETTAASGHVESEPVRQLEQELREAKERLQVTTEELESSNEELRSANEELSSMNEELQSANEELETSKEELQSINEELQTVNAELQTRVEDLSRTNNDIANLLESTQIATIFLDRDFTITRFTPTAKELFHLVESDAGRPLAHVRARFILDTIQEDVEKVLRTLVPIERQAESTDTEARYIVRMLPYRTVNNVIGGVVITFTNVTEISAAEARISELNHTLRNRVGELETLLDLVPVGIFIAEDRQTQQVRTNQQGAHIIGSKAGEVLARTVEPFHLVGADGEIPQQDQPLQRAARTGEAVPGFEGRMIRADGVGVDVMISAQPLFEQDGSIRGAIAAMVDISQHKQAEAQQRFLLYELQHRVKNILATVSSLASRMLATTASVEEFGEAFLARLTTMSRTQDLLSHNRWEGASLRALLQAEMEPYGTPDMGNVTIDGEDIMLPPNLAATLGMVFHELTTNATKYGALSAADGRISVSWRLSEEQGDRRLSLVWEEHDGPPVAQPARQGFGTEFIQRSLQYAFDGSADFSFEPDGLRCRIELVLAAQSDAASDRYDPSAG